MPRAEGNEIDGLLLALDRKKVQKFFVAEGQNFFCDIDGPRSGFSKTEVFHRIISDSTFVEVFTTEADTASWIFTKGAILRVHALEKRVAPVYTYTEPSTNYPWFYALVGAKHYFARRGVGLIEYDSVNETWYLVDGISYGSDIPSNIVACCESGGRLIVAAQGLSAWSEIDNGSSFTPSTSTGAGFQSLSKIGSYSLDSVLGVYKINEGFITLTKNGIMKSVFTATVLVYRHSRLASNRIPINMQCMIQIEDNQILYLAKDGFYVTDGTIPKLWNPLFSEYLRLKVFETLTIFDEGIFKLTYVKHRDWVVLSFAEIGQLSIYTKAWIFSIKSEKWGVFNQRHTCISDIFVDSGVNAGAYVGFFDEYGTFYKYTFTVNDLIDPVLTYSMVRYRPPIEYKARYEGGIAKMPAVWYLDSYDESLFNNIADIYDTFGIFRHVHSPLSEDLDAVDTDGTVTYMPAGVSKMGAKVAWGAGLKQLKLLAVPQEQQALESYIVVGLFRLLQNEAIGEYSAVTDVMIGMLDQSDAPEISEDWLTAADEEVDWLTITPDVYEDWGESLIAFSDYTASSLATIDGYSPIENQEQTLKLVKEDGKVSIFSTYTNGIYHLIKVETKVLGDYYHLKSLEVTGIPTGRAF